MTDTQLETRGCPEIKPVDAPPELDRFMTAMRRLDIAVSTDPDGALWTDAAERIEDLCERLELHQAPEGLAPAGRASHLPGLGHRLMPPRSITDAGVDGVTMQGHFTRYHVGGNNAVHGGAILLFFDWQFDRDDENAPMALPQNFLRHISPLDCRPNIARKAYYRSYSRRVKRCGEPLIGWFPVRLTVRPSSDTHA